MMRAPLIFTGALALAACGTNEAATNGSGAEDVPAATSQAEPPAALTVDNSHQTVPIEAPTPTPLTSIPAAFQGRWGMVANDCDPKKDYMAKGLMVVAGDSLKFYESRATIGSLSQLSPTSLKGKFDYMGEGQSWSKQTVLTLQHDGKTLVRQDDDPVTSSTYSKCPS